MTETKYSNKKALIIGAGPAGLTAAFELLEHTDIKPIIVEKSNDIGGISKTINYKGNRIDLGGHRFFSKSDRVMKWWLNFFPLVDAPENLAKNEVWDIEKNECFILRERLSRIYYLSKFFDYPVSLNMNTIRNLGFIRIVRIGFSYLKARFFPIKNEKSLEDFFINRFGKALYLTFFKDYTEKVWGVSCNEISAEWGAQRIKGLSISKVVSHYFKSLLKSNKSDLAQKNKETSLIERFIYPKLGPGQLWEKVAENIVARGGDIYMNCEYKKLIIQNDEKFTIINYDCKNNNELKFSDIDYVFSTTTVKDLIAGFSNVPTKVKEVSNNLTHRNFITVGILLKQLQIKNKTKIKTINQLIPDNWIYVQEKGVNMGRIQIFNNWSPFMVKDSSNVWLGLEYFCSDGDELWTASDEKLIELAVNELVEIGIAKQTDIIDSTVLRMENTYPVYFGAYENFNIVKDFTDKIPNLFLIGRSGMHRYNNSDHSMLTAICAVQNIVEGRKDKSNIWEVNTEQDYHEEK